MPTTPPGRCKLRGMLPLTAAALFIAIAIVLYAKRRQAAEMQALLYGGSMLPGCVVAEVVAVLVIAALILVLHFRGMF
jgi:hypothetical protein